MSAENPKGQIPLHLYQVLEEEYRSLHGPEMQGIHIRLRDRGDDILAELDWKFHQGHVKDVLKLRHKLKGGGGAQTGGLATHLMERSTAYAERLQEAEALAETQHADKLAAALNELLRVWIYDDDAFKYIPLSDALRVLLNTQSGAAEGSEELEHVNRLLLEETFPDELEKVSDIRLTAMYQRIHTHSYSRGGSKEYGHAAISLSGGGIRSGTFALGLLQGLARYNLLDKFDYLSTVSGGGYIGGWLTAWLYRHHGGPGGVTREMGAGELQSKIDPDPPAIQYLREYSNFLTPRAGLLTADTWAFIAIYLRNLLLNWLVLFPLLLALLALPRLYVALLHSRTGATALLGLGFPGRYLFLAAGSLLLVLALVYVIVSRPAVSVQVFERSGFWRGRLGQRDFLKFCLLPLVGSAFCLTTYWARSSAAHNGATDGKWRWFILFGLVVTLAAWVASAAFLGRFTHPRELGKLELFELGLLSLIGAAGGYALFLASKPGANPLVPATGEWTAVAWYACFAVPSMLLVILGATTLFVGITSKGLLGLRELLNDEDREWWARFTAWVLIAALAWAAFNLVSLHGPRLFVGFNSRYWPWLPSVGGLSGLVSLLAGFSSKSPANEERAAQKGGLLKMFVTDRLLPFLALVFLLVFLIALSLLATFILYEAAPYAVGLFRWLGVAGLSPMRAEVNLSQPFNADTHKLVIHHAHFWYVLFFIAVMTAVGLTLAVRINLNKFSLHAAYRSRLIRGFLGASRASGQRRANPFTGFDPEDNVQMHELRPVLFHEGDFENLEELADWIRKAGDSVSDKTAAPQAQAPAAGGNAARQQKVSDEEQAAATSRFLWEQLSDRVRESLRNHTATAPLPPRLRRDLIAELNKEVLESGKVAASAEEPPKAVLTKRDGAQVTSDGQIMEKRRALCRVYPRQIREKYPPPHRLLHVVNTSLNLVGGKKLAWQQRKAEPFAITPLHAGCFRVGYRRSRDYGGYQGISLGTAAAISGAAASSNMGYYTTSPVLSMVLTLFNVRLGWWLGNPGPAGRKTYSREAPRLSLLPVVQEAFGLTDDTNPYVYLTDGGHFDNLGLYEMVLRRCRLIVVSDAGADAEFRFNDLGNAVRKIRIDLGIPIVIEEMNILKARPAAREGVQRQHTYWAFGRICYSAVDKLRMPDGTVKEADDGLLIYVKPTVYGDEPRDVIQYKEANADFPHQSTGDQFFDEPQFESYRMLGWDIMNRICKNTFDNQHGTSRPLYKLNKAQFVTAALKNYGGKEPIWVSNLLNAQDKHWLS